MPPEIDDKQLVIIGRVNGIHGVRGGLKVFSYTRPRDRIFSYSPWWLKSDSGWIERKSVQGRGQGKILIAFIEGVEDRDQARLFVDVDIAVDRGCLPELNEGEYYWYDLVHLDVFDMNGLKLGKVREMRETGANDVMVVEGAQDYLIPWVRDEIVKQVDLVSGSIVVDWDPEYQ